MAKYLKAVCIRDCWDGIMTRFYRGKTYEINPEALCAVHFQFFENPKVEHPRYRFDERSLTYVKKREETDEPKPERAPAIKPNAGNSQKAAGKEPAVKASAKGGSKGTEDADAIARLQ